MDGQARVVAVLVSSPALSSVLGMVLGSTPALRVRSFDTQLALATYLRLAPVDLVVADFDSVAAPADQLASALRRDPRLQHREFQVIALTSAVSSAVKHAAVAAGIDEIVVKPMSPKYLLERVLSRLRRPAPRLRVQPSRRQFSTDSKVVPLFGRPPQTSTKSVIS